MHNFTGSDCSIYTFGLSTALNEQNTGVKLGGSKIAYAPSFIPISSGNCMTKTVVEPFSLDILV